MSEEAVEATEAVDVVQSDRPEWLPEKYNSGEDLAKAYKQLESKLGSKEEDIRNSILEEIQNEALADRPENAGAYEMPESIDPEMGVDNELLQWWSNHSFENGFSQEEFEQGIEMYAKAIEGTQPDLEAEAAKLGENASARIEAASMFANKFFPQEALPAIERMCETHEGIIALEAIQDAMKDGNFNVESEPAGQKDIHEL